MYSDEVALHKISAQNFIMGQLDYYKVLGVTVDSDGGKIKAAYRDLAFQYHPDRNRKNPVAAETMKQVNEAYAVLSDPEKRKAYDALRQEFGNSAHNRFRQTYTEQDIFSGSDIHHVFEEMARSYGFRGSEDVFKEFYGKGFRTFEYRRPGMFGGGFFFFRSAGKDGMGKGRLPLPGGPLAMLVRHVIKKLSPAGASERGNDRIETITLDSETADKGGPYAYYHKKEKKKLIVKIPSQVREGQKIRLAGQGSPGKGGGLPGDLFLEVQVRRPFLERLKSLITDR
ncbi:MAG: DnaJ domain-containing protein [Deltaproteobacteria bacterium]|nr:DnaJ domain-containing protein [Deltaproteobacteria bacterium]